MINSICKLLKLVLKYENLTPSQPSDSYFMQSNMFQMGMDNNNNNNINNNNNNSNNRDMFSKSDGTIK